MVRELGRRWCGIGLTISFMVCAARPVLAQTIYRSWVGDDLKTCLVLKEKGWSRLDELTHVKVKVRGGRLFLIDHWNNKALFGGRDKHVFRIVELTDERLVLERISIKTFDHLPWGSHAFKPAANDECNR